MALKAIGETISKSRLVNYAAALALFIYVFLTWTHVSLAVQATDPMAAFKDVLLWSTPILLNILATYGIVTARD